MKNVVLYDGPSPINGENIVVIAQMGGTDNSKIGGLIQVWILLKDVHPWTAIKDGRDKAICGNCPHRYNPVTKKRSCYVMAMPIIAIHNSYMRGNVLTWVTIKNNPKLLNQFIMLVIKAGGFRWGAYGDPATIPPQIFEEVTGLFDPDQIENLGYTHQFRAKFAHFYKGKFMASADSLKIAKRLQAKGWNTYSVMPHDYSERFPEPELGDRCQGGKITNCQKCGLCDGKSGNIFTVAHGAGKKHVK